MLNERPIIEHFSKEELVIYYNAQALEYENDIISENIIANEWIKKAVQREIQLRTKYKYNETRVNNIFEKAFYIFLDLNKKIHLMPWQCWVIMCIYGLDNEQGNRLRIDALLFMAKKNAKTFTSAFLLMIQLFENKGLYNNIYLFAPTHKQANVALDACKRMIHLSPSLRKRCETTFYNIRHKSSKIHCMSGKADVIEGTNPNVAIIDESHLQRDRAIYNNVRTAQAQQKERLIIEISTAGMNKSYPFFTVVETAKELLNNSFEQDNYFAAIYCIENDDEINDSEMWIKANPSLGYIIDIQTLKDDYNKAMKSSTALNSFITKNLNYYLDVENSWISDKLIVEHSKKLDINDFQNCRAWVGLDLSSTRDFSALSLVVEKDEKIYFFTDYFFPDNKSQMVRKQNGFSIDITGWIKAGYIEQHTTKTIDYSRVLKKINYYSNIVDIQMIGYDRWNIGSIQNQLILNFDIVECPQNPAFFNIPMKQFETDLYSEEEKVFINQNPVTRYNFQNVVIYSDSTNSIKIDKNKQKDSVDGAVSMMIAYGVMLKDLKNLFIKENQQNLQNQFYKKN